MIQKLLISILVSLSMLPVVAQSHRYLDNAYEFARNYDYEKAEKNYIIYRELTGKRDYPLEAKLILKYAKTPDGKISVNNEITINFKEDSSDQLADELDEALLAEITDRIPNMLPSEYAENYTGGLMKIIIVTYDYNSYEMDMRILNDLITQNNQVRTMEYTFKRNPHAFSRADFISDRLNMACEINLKKSRSETFENYVKIKLVFYGSEDS